MSQIFCLSTMQVLFREITIVGDIILDEGQYFDSFTKSSYWNKEQIEEKFGDYL